jgi:Icc-related predicted phosphoesterase
MKFLALHWKLILVNTDVLVTHGPPFGILDLIGDEHVGCDQLLKEVNKVKPKVHLFGHVHEVYGCLEGRDTKFINASILDDRYEVRNLPVSFEL